MPTAPRVYQQLVHNVQAVGSDERTAEVIWVQLGLILSYWFILNNRNKRREKRGRQRRKGHTMGAGLGERRGDGWGRWAKGQRVRAGVRVGGGRSGYKALFSACLQVLPSNSRNRLRGESRHIFLYPSHSFSLTRSQTSRHTRMCTHRHTLFVSVFHTNTHACMQIVKCLSLISSRNGCSSPVRKRTGWWANAGGRRWISRKKK